MNTIRFSGAIPECYEKHLGPVLFEPYAADLVQRIAGTPQHILELACGTGQVTRKIIEHLPTVKEVCATDINEPMLLAAGNSIKSPAIDWLLTDAQDMAFENNRFDLVICQFGIMFFEEKQKACNEVFRVLKPGGSFLFNTWDNFQANPAARVVHKGLKDYFGEAASDFMASMPFSFYEENKIKDLLLQAGFSNIKMEKLAKTAHVPDVDSIVTGFLKGTPLAYFLEKKKKVHNQAVFELIRKQLVALYGSAELHIPMKAIICSAEKKAN